MLRNGRQAAAAAGQNAVPVWVFLAQPPKFDRLVNLVRKRVREHSLFYRVNGEGHSHDLTGLENIFNTVLNFNSAQLHSPVIVHEARGNTDQVSTAYNPNSVGITPAPPPPFFNFTPVYYLYY